MSLSLVQSRALLGLEAATVTVEVHLANGLPSFTLVGLAETEVKEARERVRSAIQNSGLEFPHNKRILCSQALFLFLSWVGEISHAPFHRARKYLLWLSIGIVALNRPGFTRHFRAVGNVVSRTLPERDRRLYCGDAWGCRTSQCN